MTKQEKRRLSAVLRVAEYLFLENIALKLVLDLPNQDLPNGKKQSKAFTGHFELRNGELYLTQPDGHTQDVYVRDDLESTQETSRAKEP